MKLVIDELRRTQKYHLRQLEENLQKIKSYEESIEVLKQGNEKHRQTLEQIGQALEVLEKADGGQTILPIRNDYNDSIPQKEVI
jgi:tRNA nucleotidyltransferase/poly(A) polymerase